MELNFNKIFLSTGVKNMRYAIMYADGKKWLQSWTKYYNYEVNEYEKVFRKSRRTEF